MSCASATASSMRAKYWVRAAHHGAMAPVVDREVGVGDDELGVDLERVPRPSQCSHAPYGELNEKLRGASSSKLVPHCGQARCWLKVRISARSGAVVVARRRGHDLDLGHALGELQRGLERVGEAALDALAAHEAVDDDLDRVLLVAGQLASPRRGADRARTLAVDRGPGRSPGRRGRRAACRTSPLRPRTTGAQHLEAGALGQLQHPVDDLLRGLAGEPVPSFGQCGTPMRANSRRR